MADGLDYDEFYTGTFRRVVVQIYAMTGNLTEAEDSVQEAYARAWQQWGTVSSYGNPEAWVRTVARRISVSAWRKAANRLAAHQRHGPPADVPGLGPDHLALVAALRRISPVQRQVIVLFHLAGRTVEEITAETGMPGGTVKSHLSRGRKALAPFLADDAEQDRPAWGIGTSTVTEAPRLRRPAAQSTEGA